MACVVNPDGTITCTDLAAEKAVFSAFITRAKGGSKPTTNAVANAVSSALATVGASQTVIIFEVGELS